MPIRILIVDDAPVIRRHMRALLQDITDWEVCGEAVDGRDAISKTRALIPDVIILDLVMPRVNGLEAAREIKKRTAQSPILMCATFVTPQLIEEARSIGIGGIVDKIYAARSLVNGIRALLRKETFFPFSGRSGRIGRPTETVAA